MIRENPALDQALELLSSICDHALGLPLSHVDNLTQSELSVYTDSARFKWLRDLLVENMR